MLAIFYPVSIIHTIPNYRLKLEYQEDWFPASTVPDPILLIINISRGQLTTSVLLEKCNLFKEQNLHDIVLFLSRKQIRFNTINVHLSSVYEMDLIMDTRG